MSKTTRNWVRGWSFTLVLSTLVLVYAAALLSGPFQG